MHCITCGSFLAARNDMIVPLMVGFIWSLHRRCVSVIHMNHREYKCAMMYVPCIQTGRDGEMPKTASRNSIVTLFVVV